MGKHTALLPLVVICASAAHAEAIASIADGLVRDADQTDAHTLMYRASTLDLNIASNRMYCIRAAKLETGIWIGYDWYVSDISLAFFKLKQFLWE